jgi:hypothetical protein
MVLAFAPERDDPQFAIPVPGESLSRESLHSKDLHCPRRAMLQSGIWHFARRGLQNAGSFG